MVESSDEETSEEDDYRKVKWNADHYRDPVIRKRYFLNSWYSLEVMRGTWNAIHGTNTESDLILYC